MSLVWREQLSVGNDVIDNDQQPLFADILLALAICIAPVADCRGVKLIARKRTDATSNNRPVTDIELWRLSGKHFDIMNVRKGAIQLIAKVSFKLCDR